MRNEEQVLHVLAEDVSINEQASNDIFLLVDFLMFTSEANLNGEGVTVGFIQDFLSNAEDYISLPLYCDTENLLAGRFTKLGHRYSRATGSFDTVQIGGFVKFWSTEEDGVVTVYGQARIPKREYAICERIIQLYELGKLSMSFEVRYSSADTVQKDGATFIDVGENNKLTGACICWQPAFPDAQAQLLVAEEQETDESELVVAENVSDDDGADTEVSRVMPKETNENMNAETQEVNAEENIHGENIVAEEAAPVAVAEGEGASESGEGASESGEGASESGEGASEGGAGASEGGEGASEGGGESGGGSDDAGSDALTIDPDDENRANAEEQEANAEVVDHSIETYESIEKCPGTGETLHVQVVTERLVETVDPATAMAEKDAKIAELETKIAELEQIKAQYDQIVAEREAKALADKQAKAKAFAEKQGLNAEDTAVAEAIMALDYTKIAELSMAEEQDEVEEQPVKQTITLASFVEMEVSDDKYGGLLSRKKN